MRSLKQVDIHSIDNVVALRILVYLNCTKFDSLYFSSASFLV